MKITAFVGSARKKHTYYATETFLKELQSFGDIEYEIISLSEQYLQICQGCKLCLDKGEELCPLKDDRNLLLEKIEQSDGVIFATPNYSFQVSAHMKIFLDRLGFIFHRPRYFSKTFTSIVAQGVYGGNKIVKYLDFVGGGLGFNVVKGSCITTREPITAKMKQKNEQIISRQARKYYQKLVRKDFPTPSLFQLMVFRMSRSSMEKMLNEEFRDYTYYKDKGWFESDYFYPVKLNPLKKLTGRLFDWMARRMASA